MKDYKVINNFIDASKIVDVNGGPKSFDIWAKKLHANVDIDLILKSVQDFEELFVVAAKDEICVNFNKIMKRISASSDTQFDITDEGDGTFRYTYDGTGTDPGISASTVQVGNDVIINAQNFTAANNGTFEVTGVGTNYFEVTNTSGVAEADKTVGTGSLNLHSKVPAGAVTIIF